MTPDIDPEEIDDDFVPVPRASVAGVELDGEGVLYDDATGAMHLLNPTALAVWASLDGASSLTDIANELAGAFETDVSIVRQGVLDAAREFGRQSLLEGVQGERDAAEDALDSEAPRYIEPPHN